MGVGEGVREGLQEGRDRQGQGQEVVEVGHMMLVGIRD